MKSNDELKKLHGQKYVESFEHNSIFRLNRLLKYVKIDNSMNIADFGCGNGMLMRLLASKVKSYIGIDFSESFIKAANKKKEELHIDNAGFICSDINLFCQNNLSEFDLAFAMDFSEHVYDKEWVEILKSIRSSIKSNGKFYLHTPNGEFFLEKMKNKNFLLKQFPEHIAVRTPKHNIDLLKEAGFRSIKIRFLPHYNILKYVHPLVYIPIVGKYFKARIFLEATV